MAVDDLEGFVVDHQDSGQDHPRLAKSWWHHDEEKSTTIHELLSALLLRGKVGQKDADAILRVVQFTIERSHIVLHAIVLEAIEDVDDSITETGINLKTDPVFAIEPTQLHHAEAVFEVVNILVDSLLMLFSTLRLDLHGAVFKDGQVLVDGDGLTGRTLHLNGKV